MLIVRRASRLVVKNIAKYNLMKPCWVLLMILIIGIWAFAIPFGPIFSNSV